MKPFKLGVKSWKKGVISKILDERSCEVMHNGHVVRRNRVHLKKTNEPCEESHYMRNDSVIKGAANWHDIRDKLDVKSTPIPELKKSEDHEYKCSNRKPAESGKRPLKLLSKEIQQWVPSPRASS